MDTQWHELLLRDRQNRISFEYLRDLRRRAKRYEYLYMQTADRLGDSIREHRQILVAFRLGKRKEVGRLLQQHWIESLPRLLEIIDQQKGM